MSFEQLARLPRSLIRAQVPSIGQRTSAIMVANVKRKHESRQGNSGSNRLKLARFTQSSADIEYETGNRSGKSMNGLRLHRLEVGFVRIILIWSWLCACTACAPNPNGSNMPAAPSVEMWDSTAIVPGKMPTESLSIQNANNNLDVTWFEGRLFLVWRSAPTHFASAETRIHVASSTASEDDWQLEGSFHLGTDLREPQLVATDEGLLLYVAKLGTNPRAFEPQGTVYFRYESAGVWSEPTNVFPDNFIPWRIERTPDGIFEVLGYTGGENVYEVDGDPIRVRWLISNDGFNWQPHPDTNGGVVLEGGGSETALVHLDAGGIVAVVRNEGGDESGFGSKVCSAPADQLGQWTCTPDPRKFDSPLLIRSGGHVWLMARRHLAEDGHYDLARRDLTQSEQYLFYQAKYWNAAKRCAIWIVDPIARTIDWMADLPSKGDTCFPSAVRAPENHGWWLFDYTNDLDGPDLNWNQGQLAPTFIYRHHLHLN